MTFALGRKNIYILISRYFEYECKCILYLKLAILLLYLHSGLALEFGVLQVEVVGPFRE